MSRTFDDHAALYDLAFSWDVEDEIDWLLDRLGPSCRVLLEPGCGSGRMFPAFAHRGVSVVGVDRSATMLELARTRMLAAGLSEPTLICADMADFRLGATVDGAFCPVGTLGYLETVERTAAHLECVAASLRPGGRYLVQVDLAELSDHRPAPPDEHSRWEVDAPGGRLRCSCFAVAWDPDRRVETQVCRFDILDGPEAGAVYDDTDEVLLWDWLAWSALVAASPFRQRAAHGGRHADRYRELPVGPALEGMRLVWHELERR